MSFTAVAPPDFVDPDVTRQVLAEPVILPRGEDRRPLPIEPGEEYQVRCVAGKVFVPQAIREAMGAPAHGGRVRVEVDAEKHKLRLTVKDDGDHRFAARRVKTPGDRDVTTGMVPVLTAALENAWLVPGVWPAVVDKLGHLTITFD